jgi:xanthine dehydrogenase accessory factor
MTNRELLEMASELNDRGECFALVTVVRVISPTSAYPGAQAIVLADGTLHGWIGGGCAKSVVVSAAREALHAGAPKLVRITNEGRAVDAGVELHNMPCASNGEIELFIHPQAPAPLMLILGTTPAADAARTLAEKAGFRVTGEAQQGGAPEIALVATQGDGEEAALEAALASSASRVLMIASARKAKKLREVMRMRGISEARLADLEAPAGPDIGATTPAEIALAAVAGAVAARRAVSLKPKIVAEPLSASSSTAAEATDTAYRNPVCGLAVDPSNALHVIDYQGA